MANMPEVFNPDPYSQQQNALQLYYTIYRLKQLEIPESQARTALDKQKLANDAAAQFAQLTGWVIHPEVLENAMLQNYGSLTANYAANTASPDDINNIRSQMKAAGYPEADTADNATLISKFLSTANQSDPSQAGLVGRLTGSTGQMPTIQNRVANLDSQTSAALGQMNQGFKAQYGRDATDDEKMGWLKYMGEKRAGTQDPSLARPWDSAEALLPKGFEKYSQGADYSREFQKFAPAIPGQESTMFGPGGTLTNGQSGGSAIPTFAGANLAANPRTLAQSLGSLGMTTGGANNVISGAPMAGQIPSIEMQKLNQDPQAIAQSLIMAGYTKEQVDGILRQTPAYAELTGQSTSGQTRQPGATLPYNPGPALGQPGTGPGFGMNPPGFSEGGPGQYIGGPSNMPGGRPIPDGGSLLPVGTPQPLIRPGGSIGPVGPGQQLGQPGGYAGPAPGPSQAIGQPNPLMSLVGGRIQGRNMRGRQTLNDLRYNPDKMKATTGMASFYGVSPESLLGDFYKMLPKGNVSRPTRYY